MPTLAGFLAWVRAVMGVPSTAMLDSSQDLVNAFNVAMEIVNPVLGQVSSIIYPLAVYNLGGDNLANYATDLPGQTYFTTLRQTLKLTSFVAGPVSSSGDNGTSESLVVPDFMKNLSMADLQYLKTPWGRQYMAFAQRYGTLWGLT